MRRPHHGGQNAREWRHKIAALASRKKERVATYKFRLETVTDEIDFAGADRGIDGRLYFHDEGGTGKTKQIIFSVKAGHVTVSHVRDLVGVIHREKAQIGAFLSLEPPTSPMRREAASAGFYESPWGKHPRIQLLTIADLLGGKSVDYPHGGRRDFQEGPAGEIRAVRKAAGAADDGFRPMRKTMRLLNELMLDRCPHCRISHPRLASVTGFPTDTHSGADPRLWKCYCCSTCGGVVTAAAWKGDTSYSVIEYYPQLQTADEAIPDRARDFLKQAIESLHAPAGAVMLCASSVDAMLKEKGHKDGSLYERIDAAADDHLITSEMAEWAHEIRLDANDQRHADESAELP